MDTKKEKPCKIYGIWFIPLRIVISKRQRSEKAVFGRERKKAKKKIACFIQGARNNILFLEYRSKGEGKLLEIADSNYERH